MLILVMQNSKALQVAWGSSVDWTPTGLLPPSELIEGLYRSAVVVGGCRSPVFSMTSDSSVPRPSGGTRAMSTTGALGKQAMLWGVWLTWRNIPWSSPWTAKSSWMIQAQNWLSRTLMLVTVSVLHSVLFQLCNTDQLLVLMLHPELFCLRVCRQMTWGCKSQGCWIAYLIRHPWNYFSRNATYAT